MSADRLLALYERISDAPDAIARLRRFILDLAVRGKLVSQDSNDEPAAELLKRIAAEKARLAKAGEIKARAVFCDLAVANPDRQPPVGWQFATLQSVCLSITDGDHLPPPQTEIGVPFLVIGNVRNQQIDLAGTRFVSTEYYDALDSIRRPRSGDLLYTLVGSYGIPVLVRDDQPFCVQRHIGILRPSQLIDGNYLARAMESRFVLDQATACATGIAQKTVPLSGLRRLLIPLPPLDEQHRIVTKVDELMRLCDRLDAASAQRETTRDHLTEASLARLKAPNTDTFHSDARFALGALPALTARPDQIKQWRQSIHSLAVRGNLVPQDAKDEPAPRLIERIRSEKLRVGNKKGNATDRADSFLDGERSKLPISWQWAATETLCQEIVDCPHSTPAFVTTGVVCLDTTCFKDGALLARKIRYVSQADYQERTRRLVPRTGDVVFAREGSVGASVIIPDGMTCCLGQRVMLFRPMPGVLSRYFSLALSEDSSLTRLLTLHKGIGAKHVNVADMRLAAIPLPPTAEQQRIMAKVDELMALCDTLEATLVRGEATRGRLLEALLHEALASAKQVPA